MAESEGEEKGSVSGLAKVTRSCSCRLSPTHRLSKVPLLLRVKPALVVLSQLEALHGHIGVVSELRVLLVLGEARGRRCEGARGRDSK